MMSASAMIDAMISGQIGQPAASMSDSTVDDSFGASVAPEC
jgi:hypothetical protein